MSKAIKIWEGWNIYDGKETHFFSSPADVWKFFGWDIENDKNAAECSLEITRYMYMFGHLDLTEMNNGRTLVLDVVPVKD